MTKKKIHEASRGVCAALFLAAWAAALAPECAAYELSPIDNSRRDYGTGATRKLGRGLSNTGLGWVEVFKGMQDVSDESGFWAGTTWGPIYGTLNAIRRTATGVYETATFPFGGPNQFEPILEPEYVLDSTQ